jgi:hypothetical protein
MSIRLCLLANWRYQLDNDLSMKQLLKNQSGLIPLLLMILAVVVGFIVLAYIRVSHAQQ